VITVTQQQLKNLIEATLMAAGEPISVKGLLRLFKDEQPPAVDNVKQAIDDLQQDYQDRGIQLREVSSGYCFRVTEEVAPWILKLWEEKPPRYSRAFMETLALIAYRQPITRAEIEQVRGVGVSTNIIKTLLERNWVKVIGHKDVPGRPALYATTKDLLDHLNIKNLSDLPPLMSPATMLPATIEPQNETTQPQIDNATQESECQA